METFRIGTSDLISFDSLSQEKSTHTRHPNSLTILRTGIPQESFNLSSLIDEIRHRQAQQEAREADLQEICEQSANESNAAEVNDPGKLYETLQDLPTSPNHEEFGDSARSQDTSCCTACVIL